MIHHCKVHNVSVALCTHDECQPVDRVVYEQALARVAELEAEVRRATDIITRLTLSTDPLTPAEVAYGEKVGSRIAWEAASVSANRAHEVAKLRDESDPRCPSTWGPGGSRCKKSNGHDGGHSWERDASRTSDVKCLCFDNQSTCPVHETRQRSNEVSSAWCDGCGELKQKCACPTCERCQENSARICRACADRRVDNPRTDDAEVELLRMSLRDVSEQLEKLKQCSGSRADYATVIDRAENACRLVATHYDGRDDHARDIALECLEAVGDLRSDMSMGDFMSDDGEKTDGT